MDVSVAPCVETCFQNSLSYPRSTHLTTLSSRAAEVGATLQWAGTLVHGAAANAAKNVVSEPAQVAESFDAGLSEQMLKVAREEGTLDAKLERSLEKL